MKIAVITGASSGMGREMIIQLWEHFNGFDEIWIIARRMERLEELDRQVGAPLRKFALNLTKDRDLGILERTLEEKMPQVKFLVNAAGFGKIGAVDELSLTDERDMVRLNCEALCAVTRMVLPYMTCNSRIIQFASSAAFLPQPGFAIYAATKSFVLSYSRALHQELKSRNIYVTAVCPGPVKTEFFDIAETTGEIPLYKRLVMANPRRVVAKAIRDSVAGRDISVYGLTMKAFDLLCKVFPHRFILMLMDVINSKVKDCKR
ncbi:SDR family NAD(P)-dependent oxidoreductase [Enterocloster citroniae]|uniref:SDR family NAD(P)-dependent oxidoreductase n=1 Tax=Enterocloster citroniae TaxID=358743 RepID=UPI0032C18EF8